MTVKFLTNVFVLGQEIQTGEICHIITWFVTKLQCVKGHPQEITIQLYIIEIRGKECGQFEVCWRADRNGRSIVS